MDQPYFIELLNKYLKGESTAEEEQLVISYYNLFHYDPDVVALLSQGKKEDLKKDIYSVISKNIAQGEKYPGRLRLLNKLVVTTAAAAVLMIASTLTVLHFWKQKLPMEPNPTVEANVKKQNNFFHLPDGSTVILNYGSNIHYAPDFDHSSAREVFLEGQAYFDIQHISTRPFIVHTGNITTTVLGTAFNVKAMKGQENITVTVTRGKVKVSDQNKTLELLTKNQQVIFDKSKSSTFKNTVNAAEYIQWKDQEDLLLDDVTFEEIAKILEDKFNVHIFFQNPHLKRSRFTTVLLAHENLEQAVESICEFNRAEWRYDKENKILTISRKSS